MRLIFEWIDVTARAGDKVICESYVAFLYWLIEVQFEHNRQRFPNPTYFMKTPYTAYPPLPNSKCYPTTPFPVTSNFRPHCSSCYLAFLAEWVIVPQLMCYFT